MEVTIDSEDPDTVVFTTKNSLVDIADEQIEADAVDKIEVI